MYCMANIDTFFSDNEITQINESVAEAEQKTSAEIVPVLTDTSGGYDRSEDIFGLVSAVACTALFWILFQGIDASQAWTTETNPALAYSLPYVILTIVTVYILGTAAASKVWFLRHLFAARSLMRDNIKKGALRAFYEYDLSKTEHSTGICIYISLFERMVYVLGDEAISKKFNDKDFAEIRDVIIKGLKHKGNRAEGLCEGIRMCGTKLAEFFPISENDTNELPNTLRIWKQDL